MTEQFDPKTAVIGLGGVLPSPLEDGGLLSDLSARSADGRYWTHQLWHLAEEGTFVIYDYVWEDRISSTVGFLAGPYTWDEVRAKHPEFVDEED